MTSDDSAITKRLYIFLGVVFLMLTFVESATIGSRIENDKSKTTDKNVKWLKEVEDKKNEFSRYHYFDQYSLE